MVSISFELKPRPNFLIAFLNSTSVNFPDPSVSKDGKIYPKFYLLVFRIPFNLAMTSPSHLSAILELYRTVDRPRLLVFDPLGLCGTDLMVCDPV